MGSLPSRRKQAARASDGADQAALHEQNVELRRRLDQIRAERNEYKQAADGLARALNVLTAENEALRRQIGHLRQHSGPTP